MVNVQKRLKGHQSLHFLLISSFSLHFLILCPFPHYLSISSFSLHFLILCPFPHSLSISSQFPHFPSISSSFPHSLSISSQPGCKAATDCATLILNMNIFQSISNVYLSAITSTNVFGSCFQLEPLPALGTSQFVGGGN